MIVKLAILNVAGYIQYDVDTEDLDEARKLIRENKADLIAYDIRSVKGNFDTIKKVEEEDAP